MAFPKHILLYLMQKFLLLTGADTQMQEVLQLLIRVLYTLSENVQGAYAKWCKIRHQ